MGIGSCWDRFWAHSIVFWGLTFGGLCLRLIDYGLDLTYTSITVLSTEFKDAYGEEKAKAVASAAIALLVLDGLLILIIDTLVIRAKLRIWRSGLLEHPSYLYRISWIEFLALLVGFLCQDAPQLVIFVIVETTTESFGLLPQLQLVSGMLFTAYFVAQSIRNFCLFRARDREAEEATRSKTKILAKKAVKAPIKDFKDRNYTGKHTRDAVKAAIKEPRRAKKAKQDYNRTTQQIEQDMNMGVANVIVKVPRKLNAEQPHSQNTMV